MVLKEVSSDDAQMVDKGVKVGKSSTSMGGTCMAIYADFFAS